MAQLACPGQPSVGSCFALSVGFEGGHVVLDAIRRDSVVPVDHLDWPWPDWTPDLVCQMHLSLLAARRFKARPTTMVGRWWQVWFSPNSESTEARFSTAAAAEWRPIAVIHIAAASPLHARLLAPWQEPLALAAQLRKAWPAPPTRSDP